MQISPMWSFISEAKDKIKEIMKGYDAGLVNFTQMATSELMENAIKYGISVEELAHVSLEFQLKEKSITITVKNGVRDDEHLKTFKEIISRIYSSENKEALYIQRLQEIMQNPDTNISHLGLYRIVSEAKFDINYLISNNILETTIIRNY